jgi:hypothetical protein
MMSRDLPARPNLEHLKHQARRRLRDLQLRSPGAKLADALHAVARDYGFGSWSMLKTHVVSLTQTVESQPIAAATASQDDGSGGRGGSTAVGTVDGPPPNYGFGRYTPKARQALYFSRYEASEVGSETIEPQHVLLGLLRASHDLQSGIFERVHLSLEHVRAEFAAATVIRAPLPSHVQIPFAAATRDLLWIAVQEADRLQHDGVGMAHLVLGMLRQAGTAPAAILRRNGIRPDTIHKHIVQFLNEEGCEP